MMTKCAESNGGKHEAVWFHLQQQVVHGHFHHSLSQQKGSFPGKDKKVAANSLLHGLHRLVTFTFFWCFWSAAVYVCGRVWICIGYNTVWSEWCECIRSAMVEVQYISTMDVLESHWPQVTARRNGGYQFCACAQCLRD